MSIEVEQKFRLPNRADCWRRLAALGATAAETVEHVDTYFSHPGRDFARTDEALRLRRVGPLNHITYKGPKLDATTKTRREIEIPFAAGHDSAHAAAELLAALGFTPVAEVCKRRTEATLRWEDREVVAALDQLDELGDFVELEIMAEPAAVESAKACIASLARELGLADNERRSYLELVLDRRKTDR